MQQTRPHCVFLPLFLLSILIAAVAVLGSTAAVLDAAAKSPVANRGSLLTAAIASDEKVLHVFYNDMHLGLGVSLPISLPSLDQGETLAVTAVHADIAQHVFLVTLTKRSTATGDIVGHLLYQVAHNPIQANVFRMVSNVEQPLSLVDDAQVFEKSELLSLFVEQNTDDTYALVYHADDDAVYLYTVNRENGQAKRVFKVNVPPSESEGETPLVSGGVAYSIEQDRIYALHSTDGKLYQINPRDESDLQSLEIDAGSIDTPRIVVDQSLQGKGKLYIAPNTINTDATELPLFIVEPNTESFADSVLHDVTDRFKFGAFQLSHFSVFSDVVMAVDSKEAQEVVGLRSSDGKEVFRSVNEMSPSPFSLNSNGVHSILDHTVRTTQCFGVPSFDKKVCSSAQHGRCVADDWCECEIGYYGSQCELFDCYGLVKHDPNVCSGNGICVNPNACVCDTEKYSGERCHQFRCHGVPNTDENVCNGNGVCVDVDQCVCNEGWSNSSLNCAVPSCFGIAADDINVCSGQGRGKCSAPDTCECREGEYFGSQCELTTCFGILSNETDVCSGNGDCTQFNTCVCNDPSVWYGESCNLKSEPPALENEMWKWVSIGTSAVAVLFAIVAAIAVGMLVYPLIRQKLSGSGTYGLVSEDEAYINRHSVNIYGSDIDDYDA